MAKTPLASALLMAFADWSTHPVLGIRVLRSIGVLPGRVHRVFYEVMVDDTETEVRRLLAYCGLPFEAACLEFHKTERSVRTASSEQVRRPISREGVDQWRNYAPWLEPLRRALGDAVERYRD